LRNLIVGQRKHALLLLGEMLDTQHRDRDETQQTGGLNPPMARDDHVVLIDQHRIVKSEFPDRGRDLVDLFLTVKPRISGIRLQLRNGKLFNAKNTHLHASKTNV
jgi:hypothetical protein